MRIGELSKRTGVSPRSLRYYEEQGLLTSSRSDAGQRHYSDAAVQRVSLTAFDLKHPRYLAIMATVYASVTHTLPTPGPHMACCDHDTMQYDRHLICSADCLCLDDGHIL